MKTTHTPGPWRVAGHPGDNSGSDWRQIVTDATEFAPSYVAQALNKDANLIAAAPELLQALMACESALRLIERETGNSYAATFNARAAIAKATGAPV